VHTCVWCDRCTLKQSLRVPAVTFPLLREAYLLSMYPLPNLVPRLLPSFLSHTVTNKKLGRSLGARLPPTSVPSFPCCPYFCVAMYAVSFLGCCSLSVLCTLSLWVTPSSCILSLLSLRCFLLWLHSRIFESKRKQLQAPPTVLN